MRSTTYLNTALLLTILLKQGGLHPLMAMALCVMVIVFAIRAWITSDDE